MTAGWNDVPLMNRFIQAYQQRWPLHEWLTEGIEEDRLDWLIAQVLQKGYYSRQFPVQITRPFAGKRGYQTGDFSGKCSGFLTSLTTSAWLFQRPVSLVLPGQNRWRNALLLWQQRANHHAPQNILPAYWRNPPPAVSTPFTSIEREFWNDPIYPTWKTCIPDQARDIISRYYQRGVQLCSPDDVRRCVMVELAPLEHEEFGIILLDNQNQLLHKEILFRGTLNSVSVHPREVIKRVSKHNAAAIILVHNHPSGEPEPSRSRRRLKSFRSCWKCWMCGCLTT